MARYAKGRERRAEILRCALDLIGRNGFRGSTLADIADEVGLSKAGVLHYFDSKAELYAEVLRLRDETATHDGEIDLVDFVGAIRHNAEVPGLVQLFTALSAEAVDEDHEAHAFFVERYDRVRERLADAVTSAIEEGQLPADTDPLRTARLLVAVADGLQLQWLLDPSFDMAVEVEAVLALLEGPR